MNRLEMRIQLGCLLCIIPKKKKVEMRMFLRRRERNINLRRGQGKRILLFMKGATFMEEDVTVTFQWS